MATNEAHRINQAKKLIKDVETKLAKWDERSQFKLKGIGNLSRSDLDTLVLYANIFLRTGHFHQFREPDGEIGELMRKYEIIDDETFKFY